MKMGAVRGGLYDTHIIWQPIIRDLCCWVLWFQTTTPMTIKVIWLTINKVDFPRDHLLEQKLGALRAVYPLAHFPVLDFFPCYIKDGLKGWTSGLFGNFWVSLWVWGGGLAVGFFFFTPLRCQWAFSATIWSKVKVVSGECRGREEETGACEESLERRFFGGWSRNLIKQTLPLDMACCLLKSFEEWYC